MKVGVIGASEFVVGFQLVGIRDIIETKETMSAVREFKEKKDVGVVVVDEGLLESLSQHERKLIEDSIEPVFIPVSTKVEQQSLRRLIVKALGVDLWK